MSRPLAQRIFPGAVEMTTARSVLVPSTGAVIEQQSFSFEVWVKVDPSSITAANHSIIACTPTGTYANGFMLTQYGEQFNLYVQDAAALISGATSVFGKNTSKWQCIHVTANAGTLLVSVYVNGVLVIEATRGSLWTISNTGDNYSFGNDEYQGHVGWLARPKIWVGTALTATQVADRYFDDLPITTNLVVDIPFQEHSGTSAASGVGGGQTATLSTSSMWSLEVPMTKPRFRRNRIKASNALGDATAWNANTGVTLTSNTGDVTDPDGTNTASKIVYDGSGVAGALRVYQVAYGLGPATAVKKHVQRWWLRTAAGTVSIRVLDGTSGRQVTVDTTWRAFDCAISSIVGTNWYAMLASPVAVNTAFTLYAWHQQVSDVDDGIPTSSGTLTTPDPPTLLAPSYVATTTYPVLYGESCEPAQQNFFKYSSLLTTYWTAEAGAALSALGAVGPGGAAAFRLTDSAASTSHYFWQSSVINNFAGDVCCAYVKVRVGTKSIIAIATENAATIVSFNCSGVVKGDVLNGASYVVEYDCFSDGTWVTCYVVFKSQGLGYDQARFYMLDSVAALTYVGDGTGTIDFCEPGLVKMAGVPADHVSTVAQAVNTGKPPLLDRPYNALLQSNTMGNASWTKGTGVTATSASADVTDPLGTTTANKIVYDTTGVADGARMFQACTVTIGGHWYVWLRTAAGTATVRIGTNAEFGTVCAVTTTWTAFKFNPTVAATGVYLYGASGDDSAFTIYAWHAQVGLSTEAGTYAETTTTAKTPTAGSRGAVVVGSKSLAGWLPNDDPAVSCWLAGDRNMTVVSGAVSAWGSVVGGAVAIQATAGNRPLYSATAVNSSAGVVFDRASLRHLVFQNLTITAARVMFGFAFSPTVVADGVDRMVFDSQTGRLILDHSSSVGTGFLNKTTVYDNAAWRTTGYDPVTGAQVLVFDLKVGASTARLYRNGAAVGSAFTFAAVASGGTTVLGGNFTGGSNIDAGMSEFVIAQPTTDALADVLRTNLTNYLMLRAGVA